jgi:hypothetical protein
MPDGIGGIKIFFLRLRAFACNFSRKGAKAQFYPGIKKIRRLAGLFYK